MGFWGNILYPLDFLASVKWIQINKTCENWTWNELQSSCQKLGVNLNLYDQNSKEFLKLFFENLFKVGINWESLFDAVSIHHQLLFDNYERLRLMENQQIVWLWTVEKDLYFQMLSFLHGKFHFYFDLSVDIIFKWVRMLLSTFCWCFPGSPIYLNSNKRSKDCFWTQNKMSI